MQDLLRIQQLQISFGKDKPTLQGLDLNIQEGKVVGLVGESGSGKSITSLATMRLLPSSATVQGQILFRDQDLLKLSESEMQSVRGQKISMIFQEPMTSLNPVFRIDYQIMEGLKLHKKMNSAEARDRAMHFLDLVGLPRLKMKSYPHELSGGQRQRVMIAMAISCEPQLLIADEPTTALDVTIQKQILDLLQKLQIDLKMSMLFITHDLSVVRRMANEVFILRKGQCAEQGSVEKIFSNPQHPYTQGLLNCRPQSHPNVRRLPTMSDFLDEQGKKKPFQLSQLGVKEKKQPQKNKEPLLVVKDLSKDYPVKSSFFRRSTDVVRAVDNVSFELRQGDVLGLVGESGCGKTTLGRSLLRLIEPTAGQVLYRGQNLLELDAEKLRHLRRQIQIIFQDPYSSLNPRLSIGHALVEPMKVHQLYSTDEERWGRAAELMARVGLEASFLKRYPHEFSGGQRQRICIARALAVQPEFIVCDESVSALDVSVQAQVLNLLLDLKDEFGLTYIFISHDLSVIRFIADQVAVMNKGKIVEYGDVETVYSKPQNEYTQKLLSSIL